MAEVSRTEDVDIYRTDVADYRYRFNREENV